MDQIKIDRINILAKKARESKLMDSEKTEQDSLRKEYIASFRENLKAQLDTVKIKDKDGNITKLEKNQLSVNKHLLEEM